MKEDFNGKIQNIRHLHKLIKHKDGETIFEQQEKDKKRIYVVIITSLIIILIILSKKIGQEVLEKYNKPIRDEIQELSNDLILQDPAIEEIIMTRKN
ncbi:MAG: hypothetical protein GX951_00240 [Mollicutes bacterium]|nr:hypothetical protein [Mollicutes bacterium]